MDKVRNLDRAGYVAAGVYKRIATGLICGFDEAQEENRALTQVQQIDVLQMMFSSCAGMEDEIASVLDTDDALRGWARQMREDATGSGELD